MVGHLFIVALERDGGTDGTATAPATYTYTIRGIDGGETLAEKAEQQRPRECGRRKPATLGYAYADASGTVRLAKAYECETTTTLAEALKHEARRKQAVQ